MQEVADLALCRFDGEGMLHAVRIKAGKASYSNAYVQTSLYKQEKKAGRLLQLPVSHCPTRQQIHLHAASLS